MPHARLSDGRRDLGWCCSEHALILALGLIACGVPCHVAEGAVYIRSMSSISESVTRHYFVVSNSSPASVFDSSIRFDHIQGIFPPQLPMGASVLLTTKEPSASDWRVAFARGDAEMLVWFVRKHSYSPIDYSAITSRTPYGDWLTSLSVNHSQFWLAAASVIAAILREDVTLPVTLPKAQTLLKQTISGSYATQWR
jgi:hypothetical protein